jgi:hypothetical protein
MHLLTEKFAYWISENYFPYVFLSIGTLIKRGEMENAP